MLGSAIKVYSRLTGTDCLAVLRVYIPERVLHHGFTNDLWPAGGWGAVGGMSPAVCISVTGFGRRACGESRSCEVCRLMPGYISCHHENVFVLLCVCVCARACWGVCVRACVLVCVCVKMNTAI